MRGSDQGDFNDENRIIPVSTLLEGEYGERDVYAGVPTVLNRSGAYDVLEIHMTPGELARFKESTRVIREYTDRIMKLICKGKKKGIAISL
mgnify:CR=1 FL=1